MGKTPPVLASLRSLAPTTDDHVARLTLAFWVAGGFDRPKFDGAHDEQDKGEGKKDDGGCYHLL